MDKRVFYVKVLALFVVSGVAKAGIQAIAATASAPTKVVNQHTHNYPNETVNVESESPAST